MGTFDFGQFQQVFEFLQGKLNQGGALTPEEQKAYDGLMAIANQGLNLTSTGDFNSLYQAFNALADTKTKQEFERLYGTGLIQDPNSGAIQFTRPGTLVAAMQRRGMSVNDGPVQALLSEGLRNYTQQVAQNTFAAMTNSYQAMTPIRAQNIQALNQAGGLASTAIGRLAGGAAGPSVGAGEAGGGGGDIPLPPPPVIPPQPSLWDKILPGLLTTGAGGLMAALTAYLAKKPENTPPGTSLGEALKPNERPPGGGSDYPQWANQPDTLDTVGTTGDLTGANNAYAAAGPPAPGIGVGFQAPLDQWWNSNNFSGNNPTQIDMSAWNGTPQLQPQAYAPAAFGGGQSLASNFPGTIQMASGGNQPFVDQSQYYQPSYGPQSLNAYQPQASYQPQLDPNAYYGMSSQAWSNPGQAPYDYSQYAAPVDTSSPPPYYDPGPAVTTPDYPPVDYSSAYDTSYYGY